MGGRSGRWGGGLDTWPGIHCRGIKTKSKGKGQEGISATAHIRLPALNRQPTYSFDGKENKSEVAQAHKNVVGSYDSTLTLNKSSTSMI